MNDSLTSRRPLRRAVRSITSPPLLVLGALVVLGSAAVTAAVRVPDHDAETIRALESRGCDYDARYDAGRRHVERPVYTVDPPAGGDHASNPAAAGVYDAATAPSDGALVHAQEHGLVVVWYRPDTAAGARAEIDALAARFPDDLVVVPRERIAAPFVLTAWHRRLACPVADQVAAVRFVCAFRARGPERVLAGRAGCEGVAG